MTFPGHQLVGSGTQGRGKGIRFPVSGWVVGRLGISGHPAWVQGSAPPLTIRGYLGKFPGSWVSVCVSVTQEESESPSHGIAGRFSQEHICESTL